jgi:hypothetical protein
MENLYIAQQAQTPMLHFNPANGILEISGYSQPQNASIFYEPAMNWLDNYLRQNPKHITLQIKLEQFDIESSKFLFEFIFKLSLKKRSKSVVIWHYGDQIMQEAGEDLSLMLGVPFKFVAINIP